MPKKVPTIIALFVIFLLVGGISLLTQTATKIQTQASVSSEPVNLMVTNISDTQATVIWQTKEASTGIVEVMNPKGKLTAYDERDLTGSLKKYTTHSVTVKNLTPNTLHEMYIVSNGKKFPSGSTKPYTIQTGPTIAASAEVLLDPSYGIVKTSDGNPATHAIVLLTLEDSQTLSTLVRQTGSWMIPLSTLRTKDLSSISRLRDRATASITVLLDDLKTEALSDTNNLSPVPDMILGNTYDYRNQQSKKKEANTLALANEKSGSVLGLQTTLSPTPTASPSIGGISILAPKEGSALVSNKPIIQGKGIAGKIVTLTIGIAKPETGKTVVDKNGLWQYTPKVALGDGPQSVTITTSDEKGKAVAMTTTFSIHKSGSQVLGDATPSAEATPTATPVATDTGEPMPEPGSFIPTVMLILLGVGLIAGGAVFLL